MALTATSFALASAGTADATLLSGTVKVPGTNITALSVNLTSPLIESLTSGETQVLDAVGETVCPIGDTVPTVGDLACTTQALDFQFVTRLDAPGGPIVRRQAAVVNVPTLLDVDDDILPDVIGTLQVLSLTQFTLRVDRMLLETADLPMSLEAIVDDPTPGSLPRDKINAGFDARGSRTPSMWRTVATLPEDGDDELTTLDTTTTVTAPGPTLVTLGGVFDGDSLDRRDPIGGRLRYTPVPPDATLGLSLGTYLEVRAGASVPSVVNGEAEIVDGAREQRVGVDITSLPRSLAVRKVQPADDNRTITYTASAPVAAVDATYSDVTGSVIATKALVKARGLPLGMTVEQTAERAGSFSATAPLGSVEVGYAKGGDPVLMPVDHPYARVIDDGVTKSFAGRIDALLTASVDATDDFEASYRLGPDGRKKLRALVNRPGLEIDGRVSDLPRSLDVHYAPDPGRIEYEASGETIQQIDLDAVKATPFFGRVTEIHGQIKDLPSYAIFDIKANDGGLRLETNNPIGEARVLLTSGGATASLNPGEYGADVLNTPDDFTAFARVKGLRFVDTTTVGRRVAAILKLDSTPIVLRYKQVANTVIDLDNPMPLDDTDVEVDAALSAIPSEVALAIDPDAGKIHYNATAGIDSIDATVTSPWLFFGRVRTIVGHVEDLPDHVSITYKKPVGEGLRFETTQKIGDASVLLTSGPPAPLGTLEYGAKVEDLTSHFTATARVKGLRFVDVETVGKKVAAVVKLDSTPMVLRYAKDDLVVDAALSPIPSEVALAIDPDAGKVDYNASDGIESIVAKLTSTTALFGQVKRIDARVERLPAAVAIGFKPAAGSGGAFNAVPAVGKIEVTMDDGATAVTPLAAGKSGVVLRAVGPQFALFGRLFEVSGASVTSNGRSLDATLATGPLPDGGGLQDVDLDLTIDDTTDDVLVPARITGFVQDLPTTLRLNQNSSQTTYEASHTVPLVTLNASHLPGDDVEGDVHELRATLRGVPKKFTIVNHPVGSGLDAETAFSRIDIDAWDVGPQRPAVGEDGRNKVTLDTRQDDAGKDRVYVRTRVFDLKKVLVSTSGSTRVETAFGAPPAPLDVVIDGGTAAVADQAAEPLDVDITVTDLPIWSTFELLSASGMRVKWNAATPGTDVDVKLASKDVGANLQIPDLPSSLDVCFGSGIAECAPASLQFVRVDQCAVDPCVGLVRFDNTFTLVSTASGVIRMGGTVCLPFRTLSDGDVVDVDVYGGCTTAPPPWPNRIEIENLRLKNTRLEFAAGDSTTKDDDGDPADDDLLKLYLDTDRDGIRTDRLFVRNDASDTSVLIRAGHRGGSPLRNEPAGSPFFGVFDLSVPPVPHEEAEGRDWQINCGDLVVAVDLPFLGLANVVPELAETALGDICFIG